MLVPYCYLWFFFTVSLRRGTFVLTKLYKKWHYSSARRLVRKTTPAPSYGFVPLGPSPNKEMAYP